VNWTRKILHQPTVFLVARNLSRHQFHSAIFGPALVGGVDSHRCQTGNPIGGAAGIDAVFRVQCGHDRIRPVFGQAEIALATADLSV
jgi:hypothetical protein